MNISKLFTKILLCFILALAILIYCKNNKSNQQKIANVLFNDTFSFNKFNDAYSKLTNYIKKSVDVQSVSSSDIGDISKIKNGEKIDFGTQSVVNAFAGGVVVFVGDKDDFNKTVIVQGSDGFDIWYGNLSEVDVKIYDYIPKGQIIGQVENELFVHIIKDNKDYSYEEYIENQ